MLNNVLKRVRDLGEEISRISVTTHASSISYFTFISIVPILTICISLMTAIGLSEQDVVSFFVTVVPDAFSEVVETLITDAFASSGLAFSLSTLTLIWSASKSANAFRVGLNAAYAQEETRGTIAVSFTSVVAGLITDVLISATIYLIFRGRALQLLANIIHSPRGQDAVATFLNSLLTMAASVLWLSACYTYLAAGKRGLIAQLPGAICATFACGALSFGFHLYVDSFSNYTLLYGSIATVALFMLWMYLISFILVLGGIINRLISQEHSAA
ncbi:MAG: YihY/virulence factor BrkB family protein [Coriobacteriales bacterium]|nr:YihY/virulence factor BrkB family protein [Coriobacteriales bacterium]